MGNTTDSAEGEHLLEEEGKTYWQDVAQSEYRNCFGSFFYGLLALSMTLNLLQAIVYKNVSIKINFNTGA